MNETERRVLADFDVNRSWGHIEHFVENLGGRHTGSDDEKKSAEYIAEQLDAAGLKPEIQAVDSWLGVPREASLRLSHPQTVEIPCASDTGKGQEVSGEIIVIESADEARQRHGEIAGRIVVIPYSYSYPITPEEVRKLGGIGLIYGNWGPADLDILRVTAPQTWTYWGLPDPEAYRVGEQEAIPQIHIGRRSYEELRSLCRAGRVEGALSSSIHSFWGKSHQVIADVEPGRDDANGDFLMLAAHHDSWLPGATDDAAGVSVLLEAARVLHVNRSGLRRKARFLFVSGHENGAYATSTWYLDNHWREIDEHAVSFSFVDTPGFANAPEFKIEVSEELARFAEMCARDVVGSGTVINVHRPNKTADRGFYGVGVPSIYTRGAFTKAQAEAWGGAFLGYWNHSDHDTIDKLDRSALEANARIRVLEALRLASMPLLPFDFRPTVAAMIARLDGWQAAGRCDVTSTSTLARALGKRIDQIYARDWSQDAARFDHLMMRLARCLTWVNSTRNGRYGQDIFGVDISKPLAIMGAADELAHHEPDSPMALMLRSKIRRDQNKVEDAFTSAMELIDAHA